MKIHSQNSFKHQFSSDILGWGASNTVGLEKPTLSNYNMKVGLRLTGLTDINEDIIHLMAMWRHFITVCSSKSHANQQSSTHFTARSFLQAKPKTKHDLFSLSEKKKKKTTIALLSLFTDSMRRLLSINITVLSPQLNCMHQRGLWNKQLSCQTQFVQTLHSKESPVFWRTGLLLASETGPLKPWNSSPNILFSYAWGFRPCSFIGEIVNAKMWLLVTVILCAWGLGCENQSDHKWIEDR